MRFMKHILLPIVLLVAAGGCATLQPLTVPQYGSGTLIITPLVQSEFDRYLKSTRPGYFAVSVDGREAGSNNCDLSLKDCVDDAGERAVAICEKQATSQCKVFARERHIVWQGKVILENWDSQPTDYNKTLGETGFPANKSARVVCAYALEPSGEIPQWTDRVGLVKYVKEAKRRDYTLEKCIEIVRRK